MTPLLLLGLALSAGAVDLDTPPGKPVESTQYIRNWTRGLSNPNLRGQGDGVNPNGVELIPGTAVEVTNDIRVIGNIQHVRVRVPGDGDRFVPLNKVTPNKADVQTDPKLSLHDKNANGECEKVLASARQLIGTKYEWGGTSPSGVDCSGLIVLTGKMANVPKELPRTADEQAKTLNAAAGVQPMKCDLAFYAGQDGKVMHVAICADDGCKKTIQSSGGKEKPEPGVIEGPNADSRPVTYGKYLSNGSPQLAGR